MKRKESAAKESSSAGAGETGERIAVSQIGSIGFTVSSMERAIDFYTRILHFEKISESEIWGAEIENLSGVFGARIRVSRLRLGDEFIELTEYLTPPGRLIPADSRNNDCSFQHLAIVVSDLDKAYQTLRRRKIRYSSNAPQTLPAYLKESAGIKAFYFKDCDNHVLELIEFPFGKGKAKWRESAKGASKLFLGIDHTAIVVKDTRRSLEFYRDILGMKVSAESENYGDEQEHLNGVRGARLKITSLQTENEAGIGIELLQYLLPAGGKTFPKDSQANDVWHWQPSFVCADIEVLAAKLNRRKKNFVSNGIVAAAREAGSLGFAKAFLARDPDGHAARIIER